MGRELSTGWPVTPRAHTFPGHALVMLVVTADAVGEAALTRMHRDGLLMGPVNGAFTPVDLTSSPAVRALLVSQALGGRETITGLANLWIRGLLSGNPPHPVEVILPRGSRPTRMHMFERTGVRYRTRDAALARAQKVGGVQLTRVPHALACALRHEDLATAMSVTMMCLIRGVVTANQMHHAVSTHGGPGPEDERLVSAWEAVHTAWKVRATRDPSSAPPLGSRSRSG